MKHKLINTDKIDTVLEQIDETIKYDFMPTLAFVYLSVKFNLKYLVKKLKKYPFIVVGSTTVGEISADLNFGVNVSEKAISCMLVDLDKSAFSIKLKKIKDDQFIVFGEKISKWAEKQFPSPALLTIIAGVSFNNESYIEGIQKRHQHFFGAVAGDDRLFERTYVFSNNKIIENGVLVLAIDRKKIEILTSRGFGWSGIGTQRFVTKSHENIVYTIDDKPALEFYKDYLNITPENMPDMGVDYPLEVVLPNGQTVYRAAIHINEEGSLLFAGHVTMGSKVRISAPTGFQVINSVVDSVKSILKVNQEFKSDLTLIFPCTAHKELLGSYSVKEIESVFSATHNAPLIGFYTYGEIASSHESNAFHNETFVTVQLRERK